MSFSSTQLNAMEWSPRVAAAFSIPGSAWILYETLTEYYNTRNNLGSSTGTGGRRGSSSGSNNGSTPMQRALAGMSAVDILSSLAWFFSTWAVPQEDLGPFDGGGGTAFGNETTCRVQGFLLQIAIGAPMYNGVLILYYLLTIKYQYKTADLLRMEPYMHLLIWAWCIGTSITVWSLDLLHFIGPVCWIIDPPECWMEEIPEGVECNRAKKYSTALFCIPLWITILLTIYALIEIYRSVCKVVRTMERRTTGGALELQVNSLRRSNRDLQAVALRAVLYSIAFCITWTSSTIWSVAQWFDHYPFWISYMWTLMEPLQGFWNCCIFLYLRPDSRDRLLRKLSSASNLFRGGGSGSSGTADRFGSSSMSLSHKKRQSGNSNKAKRVSYKNDIMVNANKENNNNNDEQMNDIHDFVHTETNSETHHSSGADFMRHSHPTTSTTSTTKTSEMLNESSGGGGGGAETTNFSHDDIHNGNNDEDHDQSPEITQENNDDPEQGGGAQVERD